MKPWQRRGWGEGGRGGNAASSLPSADAWPSPLPPHWRTHRHPQAALVHEATLRVVREEAPVVVAQLLQARVAEGVPFGSAAGQRDRCDVAPRLMHWHPTTCHSPLVVPRLAEGCGGRRGRRRRPLHTASRAESGQMPPPPPLTVVRVEDAGACEEPCGDRAEVRDGRAAGRVRSRQEVLHALVGQREVPVAAAGVGPVVPLFKMGTQRQRHPLT